MPLAADAPRRRPAAQAVARREGHRPGRTARRESCCGFGGTFALKNADVSNAMLADKMRHVEDTGAEILSAGDNSCLTHIGGGLSRLRTGVGTMHLAEILAATEGDVR
ncbi:heterodisulfide reductase-related iron-sulfur binding cluster [Streptomyces canus]|uniref:heterodisulfide reductase-related iron-sulfur binding cluster n=1 Tax=Streptomyces canus TaxID=58343 RepID=UPI0037F62BC1